ncbi:hypothetical protein KBC70_00545 [Candidatus Woesebacteria bacterium]|nr:hypothetical protein [Candidatus Woesebacteria bacterium]
MHTYSYSGKPVASSPSSQSLGSRFHSYISEKRVQNHLGLLVGQAILLVMLALIHISFQYQAVRLESDAQKVIMAQRIRYNQQKMYAQNNKPKSVVLGTTSKLEENPVINTQPQQAPQFPHVEVTPAPGLNKDHYSIALIGDSMVDTMGESGDYLRLELAKKYPNVQFVIYNYGKGARNVEQGLADFHEPFSYKERKYSSIDTIKPDIIIVGSFAYNPFNPHDRNNHWLKYTQLVQEAQKITPHTYMLAEIAPVRTGFGLTPNGVAWDPQSAWSHTGKILEQLQNVLSLSQTLHIPAIDAYTPSLKEGTVEGKRELINPADNIHPSVVGHEFIAQKIVEKLNFEEIK